MNPETFDVVIAGAGPIGIACGMEAAKAGLSHLIIEKGCLTSAIHRFAANLVFFSTPNLLELGGLPFITAGPKPARSELLLYYRRVAEYFKLDIRLYERVDEIRRRDGGGFTFATPRGEYAARFGVLAIGFYDHPNRLGVPGEDSPKVSHYYSEPHPYYRRKVAVIGGQNSAAEAALDLHRNGAQVTLIHRREKLGTALKYWVKPDIENRIQEGSIRARFGAEVARIDEPTITIRHAGGRLETIENDFVFALTGYHTDLDFIRRAGVRLESDKCRPVHNPDTMETNVERLYIAGVAAGGLDANRIFIENGREHARRIAEDVIGKLKKEL